MGRDGVVEEMKAKGVNGDRRECDGIMWFKVVLDTFYIPDKATL